MRLKPVIRRLVASLALVSILLSTVVAPALRAEGLDTRSVGPSDGMSLLGVGSETESTPLESPAITVLAAPPERKEFSFFFCENPLPGTTKWYLVTDVHNTAQGRELADSIHAKLVAIKAPAGGWERLYVDGEASLRRRVQTLVTLREVARNLHTLDDQALKRLMPSVGTFLGGVIAGATGWGIDFVASMPRTLYDLTVGAAAAGTSWIAQQLGFGDVDLDPAHTLAGPSRLTAGMIVEGVKRLGEFFKRAQENLPLTLAEFPADFCAAVMSAEDAHSAGAAAATTTLNQAATVSAVFALPSIVAGMASIAGSAAGLATETMGALSEARSLSDIPRILAREARAVSLAVALEGGMQLPAVAIGYRRVVAAGNSVLNLVPLVTRQGFAQAVLETRTALAGMVLNLRYGLILLTESAVPEKALVEAAAAPKTWSAGKAAALIEAERGAISLVSGQPSKGAIHVPAAGVEPLRNVVDRMTRPGSPNTNTGYLRPRHAAEDLRDCLDANAEAIAKLPANGSLSEMLTVKTRATRRGPEAYKTGSVPEGFLVRTVSWDGVELVVYKTPAGELRIHHFSALKTAKKTVFDGYPNPSEP